MFDHVVEHAHIEVGIGQLRGLEFTLLDAPAFEPLIGGGGRGLRVFHAQNFVSGGFGFREKVAFAASDFEHASRGRALIAGEFGEILARGRALEFAGGPASLIGIVPEEVVGVVNLREILVARRRIQKHQLAVRAALDAVRAMGKAVEKPSAATDGTLVPVQIAGWCCWCWLHVGGLEIS